MLSYLHAYHAGNYADVLKHTVLIQVLQYLIVKDKALCFIDTHSGAGRYKLTGNEAAKTGEFEQGIAALWEREHLPRGLADYVAQVKLANRTAELISYPGSGLIAAQVLRPQDRLVLCELHPRQVQILNRTFAAYKNVYCYNEDGFSKAVAIMPPLERRGVMLVDPSYELKGEYQRVVEHLQQCYRRFATGVYLLWYPLVDEQQVGKLMKALKRSGISRMHRFEVGFTEDHGQPGMTGTGMVVVNPTFGLTEVVDESLAFFAKQLGGSAYWKSEAMIKG